MTIVELIQARKCYDKFVAVEGLSFQIPAGAIYGLLGPNGAGKTSTIRMTIGITLPDSGEVRVFGEAFQRSHLQRIGYLPEERGLYKKMKVLEHLVLLGQLHGLSAGDAARKATAWSERLQIADRLQKKVEELSKGMQQKIQFIAALLHDPDFIIMDEPFSGFDPVNAALLKDVIVELKRAGKSILFSTHQMEQVERMCDSITLMNKGKAVLQGELKQIKSSYGSNTVRIRYQGDGSFLKNPKLVESCNDFGNYVEVHLASGADPQELLQAAMAQARVSHFEAMEPSLEEIFIKVVGKTDA